MACQYFYDGKFYEENDFKKLLNDGLLDQLLIDKTINLDSFIASESKANNLAVKGTQPVQLRVLRKIQKNLNNEKEPGSLTSPNLKNPLKVLEEAGKIKNKKIPLQLLINVNGRLVAGDNKTGEKLAEELEQSRLNNNLTPFKKSLPEGYVYMLVPSAHGLYPVRIFTNKIKDTAVMTQFGNNLAALANPKIEEEKKKEIKKEIESILYRTTVDFKDGNFIVNQIDAGGKPASYTYDNLGQVTEFLGNQLYRVDWGRINKGIYNEQLAKNKVILTDLYQEDGNFFNSSSFLIQAYNISPEEKDNLKKTLTVKEDDKGSFIVSTIENKQPIKINRTNKSQERPPEVGNNPADLQQNFKENDTVIKYYNLPNDLGTARVVGKVQNGKLSIVSIERGNLQKVRGQRDNFSKIEDIRQSSPSGQQATKRFFDDIKVQKFQKEKETDVETTTTTTDTVEEWENARPFKIAKLKARQDLAKDGSTPTDPFDIFSNITEEEFNTAKELGQPIKLIDSNKNEFIPETYEEYTKYVEFERKMLAAKIEQAIKADNEQKGIESLVAYLGKNYGYDMTEIAQIKRFVQARREGKTNASAAQWLLGPVSTTSSTTKKGIIGQSLEKIAAKDVEKETQSKIGEEYVEDVQDISDLLKDTAKRTQKEDNANLGSKFDIFPPSDEDTSQKPNVKEWSKENIVDGTTWDKNQELDWMEAVLGDAYKRQSGKKGTVRVFKNFETLKHYLPKKTFEMLLEARKNGKVLHGLFTEAVVLLSENAEAGVAYHEAFHVVFNLALSFEDRVRIMQETYDKYKDEVELTFKKTAEGEDILVPSWEELEELVAEKFREYNLNNEKLPTAKKSETKKEARGKMFDYLIPSFNAKDEGYISVPSLSPEIKKTKEFFKGLSRMIKVFYSKNRALNIDNLFDNINLQVYKDKVKFKNTVLNGVVREMSTDSDEKYENPVQENYSFEYFKSKMNQVLETFREEVDKKNILSDSELIQKMGVPNLYSQMVTRVIKDIKLQEIKEDKTLYNNYLQFFNILTNQGSNVKVEVVEGTPRAVLTKSSDLLDRFNYYLKGFGIYINLGQISLEGQTQKTIEDEQDSTEDSVEDGETTREESWAKSNITINPKLSLSQKLKSIFKSIPKYKSTRKNARVVINTFGVPMFENSNVIYKELISKISDSENVSEMMEKLGNIDKPWTKDLLKKIEIDPSLITDLWTSIGNKHFEEFNYVFDINGEYRIATSNRRTIKDIIQGELISNFLVPDNPLFAKNKVINYEDINIEEAQKFLETTKKIFAAANTASNWDTAEKRKKLFEGTAKHLQKYKINITEEDIESIWRGADSEASWKNLANFLNDPNPKSPGGIIQIAEDLVQGKNPFTSLSPTVTESKLNKEIIEGKGRLESLAKKLEPVIERDLVSSFRNIENKSVYNLIQSAFVNKLVNKFKDEGKLKEFINKVNNDNFIKNLPFLKDLETNQNDIRDNFKSFQLDGLSRKGKKQSVTYDNMSDIELETTSMALFFNNNNSQRIGNYKFPIPSNNENISYLTAPKYSKEEIIEKLVQTAKAEHSRIKKIKEAKPGDKILQIKNYAENGSQYVLLDFLNNYENTKPNKVFDEVAVREAIEDYFSDDIQKDGFFRQEYDYYQKIGLVNVGKDGIPRVTPEALDTRIKDKEDFFKSYLLNTYYINTQISTLFAGDIAFYKNTGDIQKRFKQIFSPGTYTDTSNLSSQKYKAVILKDSYKPTKKETVDRIVTIIENDNNLTEEQKNKITSFWKGKLEEKNKRESDYNNESDAATYISPQRRKDQLIGLNRWTDAHEEAYKRILEGTETIDDMMLVNYQFSAEKPFYYSLTEVSGTVVPIQIKNSETVLTRSFAMQKENGNFKYPELAAVYEDMESGKYDTAIFESAIKVGGLQNASGQFSSYNLDSKTGKYTLSPDAEIIDLDASEWRLQQETPAHFMDDFTNFPSQLRNLIIADLDLSGNYQVGNIRMSGQLIAEKYQNLIVEDLKRSFEEVADEFTNDNGEIDVSKLTTLLRKEILSRELGQEYLDAIKIVTNILPDGTTENKTVLPLYHPMIMYKMQSVLNSIFRNNVTKQKMPGGTLINASSFGVSDKLEFIVDKDGTITYEAYLPFTYKKLFPLDENGEINLDSLPEEMKEIIAVRIPTEDKYSMFKIKVKGFTSPAQGGIAILPPEVTTIAGLDFDIDKLYFMKRTFVMNKEGKPEVIQKETDPKKLARNIFLNGKKFGKLLNKLNLNEEAKERAIEKRLDLLEVKKLSREVGKEIYDVILQQKEIIKAWKAQPKSKERRTNLDDAYKNLSNLYEEYYSKKAIFDEQIVPGIDKFLDYFSKQIEDKKLLNDPDLVNLKLISDNEKFDIMMSILSNKNTASSILNVADFSNLKEIGSKIRLAQTGSLDKATSLKGKELINAAEELDSKNFNFARPSTQSELFTRNMMGNKLIGIMANHNTHHAKAQFTNLELANPMFINGQYYKLLNQPYSESGRISRLLATNLAAVVDNGKDPVASFLNMNTFTANTIALLERLGVDEEFVYALINQPAILQLTKNYYKETGSLKAENNLMAVKASYKNLLKAKIAEEESKEEIPLNLTTDILYKNLKKTNTTEYLKVQLGSIELFEKLYNIAEDLSEGIKAAKIDTDNGSLAPTSSENFVRLKRQSNILDNVSEDPSILGLEEVFFGGNPEQRMIPTFNQEGFIKPISLLNKLFPFIGNISTSPAFNGMTFKFNILGKVKDLLASYSYKNNLNENEAKLTDTQFLNFIGSAFPFFNYKQTADIISKVPGRVRELKQKIQGKEEPYQYFLDQLQVMNADSTSSIERIEFYKGGKTNDDFLKAKYSWERMMIDPDPEVKQLAFDLVKYTYFSNGYGFGPYSFANIVPVMFWSDSFQKKENILTKDGLTFNQLLDRELNIEKTEIGEKELINRFFDQLIANHGESFRFVKTVKVKKEIGKDITEEKDILEKAAKENVVKTTKGNLLINLTRDQMADTQYVKVYGPKKSLQIYKFSRVHAYEVSPGFNIGIGVFKPITMLGMSNFLSEYDYYNDIEKSAIDTTPKSKKMEGMARRAMEESQDIDQGEVAMLQNLANEYQSTVATTKPTTQPQVTPKVEMSETEELYINMMDSLPEIEKGSEEWNDTIKEIKKLEKIIEKEYKEKGLPSPLGTEQPSVKSGLASIADNSGQLYTKYQQEILNLEKLRGKEFVEDLIKTGNIMTEEQFTSSSEAEQQAALFQIKNC